MDKLIEQLRKELDRYDDELVLLLHKRVELGKKIVALKKKDAVSVTDPEREQEIISRLCSSSQGEHELIKKIYQEIFSWVKKDQGE